MKNRLLRILCVLLAVPVVFAGSVSAASGARSDTTGNFTVPQGGTYTFKITSSGRPSLVAGSKSFRYVSTARSGNDSFIKFSAVGKAGDGCGFYLNGGRKPVAVAAILADVPRSDTTGNFTVPQGGTYTFKITSSGRPSLVAGSKSFRYVSTARSGNDSFIKFSAVGKAGDGCGFYLNGGRKPVAVATILSRQESGEWTAYIDKDHNLHVKRKDGTNDKMIVKDVEEAPCVAGDWVYFLPDLNEIDKVKLDGSQRTKVCGTGAIQVYDANLKAYNGLNGSTAVTAEYKDGYILYKCCQLKQAGDKLENPPSCYKLDLQTGRLTAVQE